MDLEKIYEIRGRNGDIKIFLSDEAKNDLKDSDGVLVILFYNGNLVMTYHPKRRGWEFPLGTREEDETVLDCVIRKAYEATGAELFKVQSIGYYIIQEENETLKYAIFVGKVEKFTPKPRWSETDLVKLFDKLPENISDDNNVYGIIIDYIKKYYKE
ncbi:NUDIX domain-containing protein [Caloranaerobacter azorensis]|uniref:NUDIX domain-containing protein n=1 Tax=Caloranaerobacter azorensis TaxID=116090 RepID=UPI00068F4373|nr:NUDIX domain-containing protein [Caloranaerobacter azorensis]